MSKLLLSLLIRLALANDSPKPPDPPKPIPAEKREAVNSAQKQLLAAQLDLLRYREQPQVSTLQLRQLEQSARVAGEAWSKLVADLQKELGASSRCSPDLELKWSCE